MSEDKDGVLGPMSWKEGHPPHWCAELVALGYNRPPDKHTFVNGSCTWCGHTDPVEIRIGTCQHGAPLHYLYPCKECEASATKPRPEAGGCVE